MSASSIFQIGSLAATGLIVGSFLGVLIIRLPAGLPVVFARSQCSACGHTLGPRDLVPVISWLITRGRCRYCDARLSFFYPAIEILAAILAIGIAQFVQGAAVWFSCALGWLLLVLAIMDLRSRRSSTVLILLLSVLGLAAGAVLDQEHWPDHVAGLFAGFGFLFVGNLIYQALCGSNDLVLDGAKLLGAGGSWVTWKGLPLVLSISICTALLTALIACLSGRKLTNASRLPFGTFLALGIWCVWLCKYSLSWRGL